MSRNDINIDIGACVQQEIQKAVKGALGKVKLEVDHGLIKDKIQDAMTGALEASNFGLVILEALKCQAVSEAVQRIIERSIDKLDTEMLSKKIQEEIDNAAPDMKISQIVFIRDSG